MTHSFPTRRSSDLEIKWHVACGLVPSTFLKQLLDVPLQPAISLATNFGYSQHAKRQGHGLPHLSARHAHQLQAASAQITNDAICMRDGRQDAAGSGRSQEHTSELQYIRRIPNDVYCLQKNTH